MCWIRLPEEYQSGIERQLLAAYAMVEYADAHRALDQIHRELDRINPSAARSLEEGMEKTLTVHKLRVPEPLRKSLASTLDQHHRIGLLGGRGSVPAGETLAGRRRWAGSALLLAESKCRRLKGHKEVPQLLTALADCGIT